jgi:hypothetical protein
MSRSAVDEVLDQPLSQEFLARDLTRPAFIGNGAEIVMCSAKSVDGIPRTSAGTSQRSHT